MLLMTGGLHFLEQRVHVLTIYGSSLINNWNVRRLFDLGASGVGSKVWVLTLGVLEVNPEVESARDGLWRPGGAFFQIGLGCVMSHHQSPHRRALHIPVLILAGKFKMEFLPTVSHWKGFPVAQIRPNLHKIVYSRVGAFTVAQIFTIWLL